MTGLKHAYESVCCCSCITVSLILQDLIVKIKTNQYAYIYSFKMSPLIEVKVIFKVNGQFVQILTQNDPNGLLNKVDSATSDRLPGCSSLLLN